MLVFIIFGIGSVSQSPIVLLSAAVVALPSPRATRSFDGCSVVVRQGDPVGSETMSVGGVFDGLGLGPARGVSGYCCVCLPMRSMFATLGWQRPWCVGLLMWSCCEHVGIV